VREVPDWSSCVLWVQYGLVVSAIVRVQLQLQVQACAAGILDGVRLTCISICICSVKNTAGFGI
jgi:hypothetical protein